MMQTTARHIWQHFNAGLYANSCCQRYSQLASSAKPIGEEVLLERLTGAQSGITVVALNRPQAKNALSRSLVESFAKVLNELSGDNKSRVVILRSATPGVFCAGADLKERRAMSDDQVKAFVAQLGKLFVNLEQLPMPVIAAIDGTAIGGGLEMTLACDLRVCANNAKLGLVETGLGIIPGAGGTQRLPRLIGAAHAKELIYTGRVIDGTAAQRYNIVSELVTQNANSDAAYLQALTLATQIQANAPVAIRMAKLAIDKGLQVDLRTGLQIEDACYAQVIPTKDRLEGLQAFAEKRQPIFRGE